MASNLIATCSKSTAGPSVFNTPELSYEIKQKVIFLFQEFFFTIVMDSVETKASSQLNVAKSTRITIGISWINRSLSGTKRKNDSSKMNYYFDLPGNE